MTSKETSLGVVSILLTFSPLNKLANEINVPRNVDKDKERPDVFVKGMRKIKDTKDS